MQLLIPKASTNPVRIHPQSFLVAFFIAFSFQLSVFSFQLSAPRRVVHGKRFQPLGQYGDFIALDKRGAGADALLLAAAGVE